MSRGCAHRGLAPVQRLAWERFIAQQAFEVIAQPPVLALASEKLFQRPFQAPIFRAIVGHRLALVGQAPWLKQRLRRKNVTALSPSRSGHQNVVSCAAALRNLLPCAAASFCIRRRSVSDSRIATETHSSAMSAIS